MAVRTDLQHASGTDQGRRRTNNEDRLYVDAERGIYAVIDGVGGQAAGEHAAETAVEVIRERLERQTGTPEIRLREAIALANNEIHRLAHSNPEWAGMACVLTVALIEDDVVTVGHVGDSRLYLLQPGHIAKITHDHSPVGEREDHGELGELEAMRHARRNEIYRDVGSGEREPDDPAFMEIVSFPMPADGALLLCSDGLTDLITSEEIRAGVERYAPDYDAAIMALIDAANHAGGKDNITVIVVAGPGYNPQPVVAVTTLNRRGLAWLFLAAGLILGTAIGFGIPRLWSRFGGAPPAGINAAIAQARVGDTVVIPPGKYREQVRLREGIAVRAQQPGAVTITPPGPGPAVVADKIVSGSIEGVWVLGGGIRISDSTIAVSNVYVTGAAIGIEIRGHSEPIVTASQILNNQGTGISIVSGASPKLERNLIAANGKSGVEV
ncbi:MAG TPA: protein phosphatase 2C domain-containing protein, partial [Bryobacteraceae bacterium]|nr:protein phosphatase 2C domain-containing protein [Bryobacteraceae bacterium]